MTTPTSLSEAFELFESDHLPQDVPKVHRERAQLAFYRAALFCLSAGPEAQERMRGEVRDYGRGIGRSTATAVTRQTRRDRCPHGVSPLNRCSRCD